MERTVTVRLSAETADELEIASRAQGRPVAALVREAVSQYLDIETQDPAVLARARRELDEMRSRLGPKGDTPERS